MSRRVSVAFTLGAVAIGVGLFLRVLPTLVWAMRQFPVDGYADWLAAHSFELHHDPFSAEGLRENGEATYGHPPTTLLWFLPFLRFPMAELALPLGLCVLLLLLLHTQLLARALDFPSPIAIGVLGLGLICSTMCIQSHLHAGQVSELIAFLYLLSWYFARSNEDVAAGAMIGLASTLKLFPALMVLFFVRQRRWKAVAATVVTYLSLAVAVTARLGWQAWPEFLALQGPAANQWMGKIQNGSLHGIVLRWFHPACIYGTGTPTLADTLIVVAIGICLIGAAWFLPRLPSTGTQLSDLLFAFFSVLSIFLNPWVWEHYNVIYMLPIAVALAALRSRSLNAATVALALLVGTAAALLSLDTSYSAMDGLQRSYHADPTFAAHLRLHLLEIGHWAPQVLLLSALLWLSMSRSPAAADRSAS